MSQIRNLQLARIKCRACRKDRWDDGKPCEDCGAYENRFLRADANGRIVDTRKTDQVAQPSHRVRSGESEW